MMKTNVAQIKRLNSDQLPELLFRLLSIEARVFNIPLNSVKVSFKRHVGDAGEDGSIEWSGNPVQTDFLPTNKILFQCKATATSQSMTIAACADEIGPEDTSKPNSSRPKLTKQGQPSKKDKEILIRKMKSRVEEMLDQGSAYILFCTEEFGPEEQRKRIQAIKDAIKACGKAYADKVVLKIYSAKEISDWANLYISAITYVYECTGTPLSDNLKTWDEWQKYKEFRNPFVSYSELEDDKNSLFKHIEQPGSIVRISGLTGLGKTHFTLECFRKQGDRSTFPINSSTIVSLNSIFVSARNAHELLSQINAWKRQGQKGVIIVDDCPINTHQLLARETEGTNISLVTIGDEKSSNINELNITFKPYNSEIIKKIILDANIKLAEENLEQIARFSKGFPGTALHMAKLFVKEGNIGNISDADMINKFLWGSNQRNDEAYEIILACSLFNYFGIQGEASGHYKFIAENFCKMDPERFYALAKRYFFKRNIMVEHGRFASVEPFPIAWHLAQEWWYECSFEKAIRIINALIKTQWLESFLIRLTQLDSSAEVQQITQYLLSPNGIVGNLEEINTEKGSKIFYYLVEINPHVAARSLQEILEPLTNEEIRAKIGPGRTYLVWALQKLCLRQECFEQGARLLLQFALAENQRDAGNATNTFIGLFQAVNANSQVPPLERLVLLKKLIDEDNEALDIIIEALGNGLPKQSYMRFCGVENQGSKVMLPWMPPDFENFDPKINQKIVLTDISVVTEYHKRVLNILTTIAVGNSRSAKKAADAIAANISSLLSYGFINELKQSLVLIKKKHGFWIYALKELISFIKYNQSTNGFLEKELIEILNLLKPATLSEQVLFHILNYWDDRLYLLPKEDFYALARQVVVDLTQIVDIFKKSQMANSNLEKEFVFLSEYATRILALECSANIEQLDKEFYSLLFHSDFKDMDIERKVFLFGQEMAKSLIDEKHISYFLEQCQRELLQPPVNILKLIGFIKELNHNKPYMVLQFLDHLEQNSQLYVYMPAIIAATGKITKADSERLLRLLSNDGITLSHLSAISNCSIDIEAFNILVSGTENFKGLSGYNNEGYVCLLELLARNCLISSNATVLDHFKVVDSESFKTINLSVKNIIFKQGLLTYLIKNRNEESLGLWINLLEQLLHSEQIIIEELINSLREILNYKEEVSTDLQTGLQEMKGMMNCFHIISQLVKLILNGKYIEVFWPVLSEALLSDDYNVASRTRKLVFGHPPTRHNYVENLPIDHLLNWCKQHPKKAPAILAQHVKLVDSDSGYLLHLEEIKVENYSNIYNWTKLATSIIDAYGDNEEVLKALTTNLVSFRIQSINSLKNYKKLFEQLRNHQIPAVREWAIGHINSFEQSVSQWEVLNSEMDEGILFKFSPTSYFGNPRSTHSQRTVKDSTLTAKSNKRFRTQVASTTNFESSANDQDQIKYRKIIQSEHDRLYANIQENRTKYAKALHMQQQALAKLPSMELSDYTILSVFDKIDDQDSHKAIKQDLYQATKDLIQLHQEYLTLEYLLLEQAGKVSHQSSHKYAILANDSKIIFEEKAVSGDGWCAFNTLKVDAQVALQELQEALKQNTYNTLINCIRRSIENSYQASISLQENFDVKGSDKDGKEISGEIKALYQACQTSSHSDQKAYLKFIAYIEQPQVQLAYLEYISKAKYADSNIVEAYLSLKGKKLALFIDYGLSDGKLINCTYDGVDPYDPLTCCLIYHPNTSPLSAHYNRLEPLTNNTLTLNESHMNVNLSQKPALLMANIGFHSSSSIMKASQQATIKEIGMSQSLNQETIQLNYALSLSKEHGTSMDIDIDWKDELLNNDEESQSRLSDEVDDINSQQRISLNGPKA